jgi:glycosyltransferase involved in cell wall biosynthesis
MKVLMFGWEFPPAISGGLGKVCYELTRHLTQMNDEILFAMPKARGDEPAFDNFELLGANEFELTREVNKLYDRISKETATFLEIDSLLEPYSNIISYRKRLHSLNNTRKKRINIKLRKAIGKLAFNGGYGKNLLQEVSRYAVIGSLLGSEEDFDVIHAHDWITFPAAVEAKKASNKPLICHIHATEFDRSANNPTEEIYNIEKYGLEMADRVITVSQRTKDIVVMNYGINPDKVFVVHNAVSKEKQLERHQVKKNLSEKIVLFLGRVTIQKGPDYFVEAARIVLDKIKNVRFVMAGSGDMLNGLIERIAHYRMQKNFHFTGFMFGKEVEEILAMSDAYVMPSVSEPFGITPFEAMLYHVPIVISKQSGIAEVLPHAVKVDFWDVEKLARSIINILTDEQLANRLVKEGAKELDQVSWHTAAQKVDNHYRELVAL